MAKQNAVGAVLKDACQITGATWAICVERTQSKWELKCAYRLTKIREKWIYAYLADDNVDRWLCGAIAGGRSRSRKLAAEPKAGTPNLYTFPLTTSEQILIVGGNDLSAKDKKLWRMIAKSISLGESETDLYPPDAFIFGGQISVPYNLPRTLDRILARIMHYIPASGGWLALSSEHLLRVEAQKNSEDLIGKELTLDNHTLLGQIRDTRTPLRLKEGDQAWNQLTNEVSEVSARNWVALPLTIGQRLIGVFALWRNDAFSDDEWLNLQHLSVYAAASAEMFITFSEMADHLKRQAMLNDFALIISSASVCSIGFFVLNAL